MSQLHWYEVEIKSLRYFIVNMRHNEQKDHLRNNRLDLNGPLSLSNF